MDRSTAGFYHDRPLWLGASPVDRTSAALPNFDSFRDVVVRKKLANGIEVKATREGFVAFSFAAWEPGLLPPEMGSPGFSFEAQADAIVRRTLVMNSFLAFMYSNEIEMHGQMHQRMVVTPELVISMEGMDGGMGFGNSTVAHLAMSSYPGTYMLNIPPIIDQRISMRGFPVPADVIERAVDDLSNLMNAQEDGALLVDLFLRASKSHQDHNYSSALIGYWAVSEKLLQELWHSYQEENRMRDGKPFINSKRMAVLNDGRSFTASVMAEFLSLAGKVDFDLYEKISLVRRARNSWMHSLTPGISSADALSAGKLCEAMLKLVRNVSLRCEAPLTIHG